MDVHKAGGGIHFTVEKTRQASEDELFSSLETRLKTMQKTGTTLVECKSGYGLNVETEIKMLKVIDKAKQTLNIGVSSTFCGAHAVPRYETSLTTVIHFNLSMLNVICLFLWSFTLHSCYITTCLGNLPVLLRTLNHYSS